MREGAEPVVDSPSGHAQGDGNGIGLCVDGRTDTKWCIANPGSQVVWRVAFPVPKLVESYVLTSANDIPARDPQSWVLEGSEDGKAWQELDRRELGKPFEKRFQAKTFAIAKPQACRFTASPSSPRTRTTSRSPKSS